MKIKKLILSLIALSSINSHALTIENKVPRPCGGGSSPGCKIVYEKLTISDGVEGSLSQEILSTSAQKKTLMRSGARLTLPLVVAKTNEFFNVFAVHHFYIRNETGYPHLYAIEAKLKVMDKVFDYQGSVDLKSGERYLNDLHSSLYGLKIDKRGTYGIYGQTLIGEPDFSEWHYTQRLEIHD